MVLGPFRDDDADAVVAACRDPLVQRFTRVPIPYGLLDAHAFIDGAPVRRARGESLELAVRDRDGRLLGAIGFIVDRFDPGQAEVGYWVAPAARGRGIATRALRLLSAWALREAGLVRLSLTASLENPASLRVAERAGFRREGIMRDAWPRGPRGREDLALYGLLAADLGPPA